MTSLCGVIGSNAAASMIQLIYSVNLAYSTETLKVNKKTHLSLTNPRDAVEIWVTGHSRASKVTPFDCLHMLTHISLLSYYRPIVTLCLKKDKIIFIEMQPWMVEMIHIN